MARVTVVGTGLLGSGIAEVLVRHGHEVTLHDFAMATLSAAHRKLSELGIANHASLRAECSLDEAVANADFVVEAVTEQLSLKQVLFERIGTINRRAILMSNSSVLPIGEIARRTVAPERAVGSHWWNPPQLIPIVEVIRGPRTSEDVVRRVVDWHAALGKQPVRVECDVPGFIGNRIQHALWREALALVSDGNCDARTMDRIVSTTLGQTLAARGPWAEMESIGWPQVMNELASLLPLINSEPVPAPLLRDKVAQGQLGAKSGQGFLTWEPGARERAAERLAAHVAQRLREPAKKTSPADPPTSSEEDLIVRRLRVAIWREALSLIERRICTADDLDRVVVNTIGLRLAAMGPLENADFVGLDLTLAIHEAVLPSLETSTAVPALVRSKVANQAVNL